MFYSQFKQDEFLENYVFNGYKKGFFVDVGAHDGVSLNNTLYFEKENDWTGINVEPIKSVYDKLVKNRPNCINVNKAICGYNGTAYFLCNDGYTETLSGLKNNYDERHLQRLEFENKTTNSTTQTIIVDTKRFDTLCEEYNVDRINYLSIDVEGAEFEVIKSINFDKTFIDVIGFESNYEFESIPIIKYLEDNGYRVINQLLDIFMIHKNSKFYKDLDF